MKRLILSLLTVALLPMTVAAQTDEQYTAATANITAGTYRIYAKSGGTKYYLKVSLSGSGNERDFCVTTSIASEASQFEIAQSTDGSSKLKDTAWKIVNDGWAFTNPSGGSNSGSTFTAGTCLRGYQTSSRTSEFDRQVLYYAGSAYAVRSTNSSGTNWGAGAYWGINGSNNACYVSEASYIWYFEPVIETGYYLVKSTGISSGNCYMTSESSAIYRSPKSDIYAGTDNADVWQLVAGSSAGYSLKSVKENSYAKITSSASNSGMSFSLSATQQDWTFIPTSSDWYATDGSTSDYRWLNFNTSESKGIGVWSYDANNGKFKLIPMSAYTLTVLGQTDATVTIATTNHKSSAANGGTVYIDSDISSNSALTVTATTNDAVATVTNFDTTNKTIEVTISYSRTFASSGQNYTVCLPFVATTSSCDGTFYELSSYSANTLHFTEFSGSTTIYKPYLFVPSSDNVEITGSITMYDAGSHSANLTTSVSGNAASFIGTMTRQTGLKSDDSKALYGFSNGSFKKIGTENGVNINPFRAYISIPVSQGAPEMLNIDFGGNTTGINTVNGEGLTVSGYYDLQGRRVAQPAKGIYIVNGKKVVVK